MTDRTDDIIIQAKCARIIELLSQHFGGDRIQAMDTFYNSSTAQLMQDKVADLHCRSDQYLAEEIYREFQEKKQHEKDTEHRRT